MSKKLQIKTFWAGTHANTEHAKHLYTYVPQYGECENEIAEEFRAISRICYDYYNNGLGNFWDGEYLYNLLHRAHSYVRPYTNDVVRHAVEFLTSKVLDIHEDVKEWERNASDYCDCEEFEETGEFCCLGYEPDRDVDGSTDKFEIAMNIFMDAVVVKATKELEGKDIDLSQEHLDLYESKHMEKEQKSKTHTDVKVKLLGKDGNAMSIIAKVSKALKKAGHKELAEKYREEAMSDDYNNVLITTMKYVEVS